MTNPFTFKYLEEQLDGALECGYEFLTCVDFVNRKNTLGPKTVVMRVDIDESVPKVARILDIFRSRNIKATFFLRLHADYNPFSFSNYSVIRRLIEEGHELGYHSEIIDQSVIWEIPPTQCLRTDLEIMGTMFDVTVQGVASHGGRTGLNNLDFWKTRKPNDFGLSYEAYDEESAFGLFKNSLYISDSEWTQWKSYNNGRLQENDRRSLIEHLEHEPPRVYLLIHPETYFDLHPYE